MQKPTSKLIVDIIDFVCADPQIKALLDARNTSNDAAASQVACAFYRSHPTNERLSAYRVDFVYRTRYPQQEEGDDLIVIVEVQEGNAPDFRIVSCKAY